MQARTRTYRDRPPLCWHCRCAIPPSPDPAVPATCCTAEGCVAAELRYARELRKYSIRRATGEETIQSELLCETKGVA